MKLGLPLARGAERASAPGAQGPTAADHEASPPRPPSALVAAAELCIAMFLTTPWLWSEPPVDARLLCARSCARHRPSEAVRRARLRNEGSPAQRREWRGATPTPPDLWLWVSPASSSVREEAWLCCGRAHESASGPMLWVRLRPVCGELRSGGRTAANGRNPRPPAKVWAFTCHPRPF